MNQPSLDQARRDLAARFHELRTPCESCRGRGWWGMHNVGCDDCRGFGYVPNCTLEALLEVCGRQYKSVDFRAPGDDNPNWAVNIYDYRPAPCGHGEGSDANTALIWALHTATENAQWR